MSYPRDICCADGTVTRAHAGMMVAAPEWMLRHLSSSARPYFLEWPGADAQRNTSGTWPPGRPRHPSPFVGLPSGASAQTTIGTSGAGGLTDFTPGYWVGQTFTAPSSDNILDSFQLWVRNYAPPGYVGPPLSFRAYVTSWDQGAGQPGGPALFESPVRQATSNDLTPFSFTTGGTALTPGGVYAMYLDASSSAFGATGFVETASDDYAGGNAIAYTPFNGTWQETGGPDLHFEATFSDAGPDTVVPEPSTWVLLLTGLLGLGVVARIRTAASDS